MSHPTFVLLYVDSPARSEKFYTKLLGTPAIESSPTFALFALQPGLMLGLWQRDGVEPAASAPAGGNELAFAVENNEAVLATDPDGHRLRVFAPAK
ncbi:drug:proton antiporter [Pigmentiphaga aceris]|uniref:Drug:proton antiporter n=1 Tax=Pigmentiphaga aceris TaxID=1940612 RepID=A0A5C0AWY0_9BURK|nr:VOC family protein [Pigmentiphaga aceris]QEI05903.1 drug:proton antiporter [Pigmentiphaga aceris]